MLLLLLLLYEYKGVGSCRLLLLSRSGETGAARGATGRAWDWKSLGFRTPPGVGGRAVLAAVWKQRLEARRSWGDGALGRDEAAAVVLVALHCGAAALRPSGPVFVRTLSKRIVEHLSWGLIAGVCYRVRDEAAAGLVSFRLLSNHP